MDRPTEEKFASVTEAFALHELTVEDAVEAHQRPKAESHDGTLFVVLRPARYVDETETVQFSEAHGFVGEGFVVTVRHGEVPAFSAVRNRVEGEPELLRRRRTSRGRLTRHHGPGGGRLRPRGGGP
jgi:magnesium transporter